MTTLTEIAAEVFDAVAAEIDGVVKAVSLSRTVRSTTYDPTTGAYTETTTTVSGRGIAESERTARDAFPEYTFAGTETLWFVAELGGFVPREGDSLSVGGTSHRVLAARDILENEQLFRVLVV